MFYDVRMLCYCFIYATLLSVNMYKIKYFSKIIHILLRHSSLNHLNLSEILGQCKERFYRALNNFRKLRSAEVGFVISTVHYDFCARHSQSILLNSRRKSTKQIALLYSVSHRFWTEHCVECYFAI